MLQYLYFSSYGYCSVCHFVFMSCCATRPYFFAMEPEAQDYFRPNQRSKIITRWWVLFRVRMWVMYTCTIGVRRKHAAHVRVCSLRVAAAEPGLDHRHHCRPGCSNHHHSHRLRHRQVGKTNREQDCSSASFTSSAIPTVTAVLLVCVHASWWTATFKPQFWVRTWCFRAFHEHAVSGKSAPPETKCYNVAQTSIAASDAQPPPCGPQPASDRLLSDPRRLRTKHCRMWCMKLYAL